MALMLFTRDTVAQSCRCIRGTRYTGHSEERELARLPRIELVCVTRTQKPQVGESLTDFCAGSCPALDSRSDKASKHSDVCSVPNDRLNHWIMTWAPNETIYLDIPLLCDHYPPTQSFTHVLEIMNNIQKWDANILQQQSSRCVLVHRLVTNFCSRDCVC